MNGALIVALLLASSIPLETFTEKTRLPYLFRVKKY